MTLTAHSIVGGAIVSLMPAHPVLGLCFAFASHFVLDAIPHWDYPIRSALMKPDVEEKMQWNGAFLRDAIAIYLDATLGIALAVALFGSRSGLLLVASGACAAIFPDALQFAYMRCPRGPLPLLQRFHCSIHSSKKIRHPLIGVSLQVAFVAAIVVAVRVLVEA